MEHVLKEKLHVGRLDPMGRSGGGSISNGFAFHSDMGDLFVKSCKREESRQMFDGEMEGLSAILRTNTVLCPHPIGVYDLDKFGNCLVTEYIQMNGRGRREAAKILGKQLAEMHRHNSRLIAHLTEREGFVGEVGEGIGDEEIEYTHSGHGHVDSGIGNESGDLESAMGGGMPENEPVKKFGFHIATCCGAIPQNNSWKDSWPEFFVQNRLKIVIEQIIENHGDRDLLSTYPILMKCCEDVFSSDFYDEVPPALVHGDLHGGNWAVSDGQPVIFDPSVSYSDPEFEAGIMEMFGGFGTEFWAEYHKILPRRKGDRDRIKMYELYHHLNHWNHFGAAYKHSTMDLIRVLQSLT